MAVAFEFDFDSTLEAIRYLASSNVPELTKYKLCKLLFLADKYHLVKYGRVITGDKYCALPLGPVPSRILNLLNAVIAGPQCGDANATALADVLELERHYLHPRFVAAQFTQLTHLSESDKLALDKIVSDYGRMGFGELKAITHEAFAYKQVWNGKPEGINSIDMDFEDFFEEDSDAVVGARDAMIEDDLLRNALSGH